jgi:hypothetical protein
MSKFIKGQQVKFYRNEITKIDLTIVSAIVLKLKDIPQSYIIEFPQGWTPSDKRVKDFELDVNKKYLFVSDNELTAI